MPLFGWWMKLCRTVFLDPPRHLGITNQDILSDAAAMLQREKMNIVMFPVSPTHSSPQICLVTLAPGGQTKSRKETGSTATQTWCDSTGYGGWRFSTRSNRD